MTTKNKAKYTEAVTLADDEFDSENVKIRITTFVDADILKQLRSYASKNKIKYQTALNSILRSFFEGPKKGGIIMSFEQRVRQIVKEEMKRSR